MSRPLLALFGFLLALGAPALSPAQQPGSVLYVGSYTLPVTATSSKGIYGFRFDEKTGELSPLGLAVEASNPAHIWPSLDERFLYSVNWQAGDKVMGDSVSAFSVEAKSGQLTFLNKVSSHGESPNQIVLDPSGKIAVTVTFKSGTFSAFPIEADGRIGEACYTDQHPQPAAGSGQPTPKTHGAVFSKDGKFCYVAELGLDRVYSYRVDAAARKITPAEPPFVEVKSGLGPRRLQIHPNGKYLYVNMEAGSAVSVFEINEGRLKEIQMLPTIPADFQEKNTTAEIQIDHTGRFLYVSNRGHDTIAFYSVDFASGLLKFVEYIPSLGKTPRNLLIDPTNHYLFCSNQGGENVVPFRLDPATGHLTPAGSPVHVAQPGGMALVKGK